MNTIPNNEILHDMTHQELTEKLEAPWPEPESITTELLPVDALDYQIIPDPLIDFVVDVSDRMQCPIDFVAVSAIIAISSIIGAGCGIKPKKNDDWIVIPNLWGCIVGRPGMMKSPAVSEVMRLLDNLESQARMKQEAALSSYHSEIERHRAKKEALKSELVSAEKQALKKSPAKTSADELQKLLAQLQEPSEPIRRRYKTNDSTIEKLSELLAHNPRGLLLYRDELTGLLKSCEKAGHEGDRAFFLEAWNGDASHTSDRIGRGTIEVENLCLSIFGTTQPDKLIRYLFGAIYGENDGLIQRFQLLIYPDEPKEWEMVDRTPLHAAKDRLSNLMKNLSGIDFESHGAMKKEQDHFPYFHFSEEAQELFYRWWEELETKTLKRDEHPILIEHFSKYRKLMPALALTFHLIDIADGNQHHEISIKNVGKAIAWCKYLHSHAHRIYALVLNADRKAASVLAEKIRQGKLNDGFTARDVYRANWSLLNEKSIAQAACHELVESGWIRKILSPSDQKYGGYKINPKIRHVKSDTFT